MLSPGACQTVSVTYTANNVGASTGSVEVSSNDPVNGTASVELSGNGTQVSAIERLNNLESAVIALNIANGIKGQLRAKLTTVRNHMNVNPGASPNAKAVQARLAIEGLEAFKAKVIQYTPPISAAVSLALRNDADALIAQIRAFGLAGNNGWDALIEKPLPTEIYLSESYPNPFNSASTIRFSLPEAAGVDLSVFDLTGRQVMTLVSGEVEAGFHSVTLDGNNLCSGMYLVRMNALGQTEIVKVTYIK